jgi:RNA polymerase sigma-70 factor (ECF subfamily)
MDGATLGLAQGGGGESADRLTVSPETLAFYNAHGQDTAHPEDHRHGTGAAGRREFERIVLPHLDAAYNLARWLTRDPATAEDVVQDAVLRALQYFASCRSDNGRAWLLRIVRNTYYTALRRQRTEATVSLGGAASGGAGMEVPELGPDPETLLAHRQQQAALDRALSNLPVELRECLVLRELEELSYKEIARITGVPVGTVMSRLWRARQALMSILATARERSGATMANRHWALSLARS